MADGKTETELTDRLHKWQKSLETTGQSTEVLGWLLIFITPIVLLLQQNPKPAAVLGVWLAAVFGGLYYIFSGRYIRYTHGKHTTKFLALNGLVTLIIATGIIPIIVIVESWITFFKYRKENKRLKSKAIGAKSVPFNTLQKVLLIVFIVAGGSSIIYINHKANSGSTSSANGNSSASSQFQQYTSAEDSFIANFPGIPAVSHSTVPVNGDNVPQTTYEKDLDNGNTSYVIAVTHYPASYQFTDIKGALQGAANGEVQNTKGAQMVSTNFITFLGGDALDSQYTVPSNGSTYTVYSRNLLKGNNLYSIFTINDTQDNFNNFANSLQFTQ